MSSEAAGISLKLHDDKSVAYGNCTFYFLGIIICASWVLRGSSPAEELCLSSGRLMAQICWASRSCWNGINA